MSPYENRYQLDGFHRFGYMTWKNHCPADAHSDFFQNQAQMVDMDQSREGISHLDLFSREIDDTVYYFMYGRYSGENRDDALRCIETAYTWITGSSKAPAASGDLGWRQMEMMNLVAIRNTDTLQQGCQRNGLIASLVPDKELMYRTLHQTNWPGVVDQLLRSNYRNWTTFLTDVGDQLFLFTYYEYIGTDRIADDAAMAADPVTKRWWTHTQPCLGSVPGSGDTWSPMERLRTGKR